MPAPKLRIGLAGLDQWYAALALAEIASRRDDVELVGIADRDSARAAKIAERFAVHQVSSEPEELAADASLDAVMTFASTDCNPGICIAAASGGNHILSGKPMARTLEDAARIARAVRESGVRFVAGESLFRFTGWYRQLEQWIAEDRLGEPVGAYSRFWAGLPQRWPDDDNPGWYAEPGRAAGGAWIDHAIYSIDLLRSLWRQDATRVSGTTANVRFPSLRVEDHGVGTVEFSAGPAAVLEATWAAPPGVAFEYGLRLLGTKGGATFDSRTGELSAVGTAFGSSGWADTEVGEVSEEQGLFDHFVAVAGGADSVASVDVAQENLAVGLAFYDAVRAGTTVVPSATTHQATGTGH